MTTFYIQLITSDRLAREERDNITVTAESYGKHDGSFVFFGDDPEAPPVAEIPAANVLCIQVVPTRAKA